MYHVAVRLHGNSSRPGEHGRTLGRSARTAKPEVPGGGVEFAEDGPDLVTAGPNDVGVRARLDRIEDIDALGDRGWDLSLPSGVDDAVAGNRVHLDDLNIDRELRALAADEARLLGKVASSRGALVKKLIEEEVSLKWLSPRRLWAFILRSKNSQSEDEVVDDLMGSDCGNAFIRGLLDQWKGAGGGEGEEASGGHDAGETHSDGFDLGLTKKRLD